MLFSSIISFLCFVIFWWKKSEAQKDIFIVGVTIQCGSLQARNVSFFDVLLDFAITQRGAVGLFPQSIFGIENCTQKNFISTTLFFPSVLRFFVASHPPWQQTSPSGYYEI